MGCVRLNWKLLRFAVVPALVLLGAGCGGFSATRSVSPASFFLPGIMKADPAPATPGQVAPAATPLNELAAS
jgi:hypothetical protein